MSPPAATAASFSARQRFLDYLDAYAAKDIDRIAAMLADDVVLRDWKIRVRGRDAALAETRANFAAARSIAIEPLQLYEHADGHGVAGELRIVVDGDVELHVVDVLRFDAAGRIAAVRAYLGRGDGD